MKDIVTSFIRTIVPLIVASIADVLAHIGLNLDPTGLGGLEAFLLTLFTGLYYVVVRLFEHYVSPHFGWLLGYAKAPSYTSDSPIVTDMQIPNPATAK